MSEVKEKILVLQEGTTAKRSKWSVRRYLTETWNCKWWVLGATVIMSLAGAFGLEFAYNHPRRLVTSSFSCEIPCEKVIDGGRLGPSFVLYGGSVLPSSSIYSLSNIQSVIDENPELANLNAEAISKTLSFSVMGSVVNGLFVANKPYSFSIETRLSAFKSNKQAESFVTHLVERPLSIARSALANYYAVPTVYDGFMNLDYSEQASLLMNRAQSIKDTYLSLLADFSPSVTLSDGKTTLWSEYERFTYAHILGSTNDSEAALGEASSNSYLKFTNTPEGRDAKISELKWRSVSLIDNAKSAISDLVSSKEAYGRLASTTQIVTTETDYTDTMLKLNAEISAKQSALNGYLTSLKRIGYVSGSTKDMLEISSLSEMNSIRLGTDLKECGGYIQHLQSPLEGDWANSCVAFETKMKTLKASYDLDIASLNDNFRFIQSHYAGSFSFLMPSIIAVNGGMGVWIGAVAGFFIGFLASSIICTFVEIWKKDQKEEQTSN